MKRGLTLLLASLVLAIGLTACGGDTKQDHRDDDVNGGNQDSLLDDAEQGMNNAVQGAENAIDDMTGNPDSHDQQLRTTPGWNGNLNGPSPML